MPATTPHAHGPLPEWRPQDPHTFWGLKPEHQIGEGGQPFDEHVGNTHIVFGVSQDPITGEYVPVYDLHDTEHACYGHLHDYKVAMHLGCLLSAVAYGLGDELSAIWIETASRIRTGLRRMRGELGG